MAQVLAPVSNNTKDFVPRVAAALGVSPVTDVCDVLGEDTFVRPFYAGNAPCGGNQTSRCSCFVQPSWRRA